MKTVLFLIAFVAMAGFAFAEDAVASEAEESSSTSQSSSADNTVDSDGLQEATDESDLKSTEGGKKHVGLLELGGNILKEKVNFVEETAKNLLSSLEDTVTKLLEGTKAVTEKLKNILIEGEYRELEQECINKITEKLPVILKKAKKTICDAKDLNQYIKKEIKEIVDAIWNAEEHVKELLLNKINDSIDEWMMNEDTLKSSEGSSDTTPAKDIQKTVAADLDLKMLMMEDGTPKGKCYCSCNLNNQPVFLEINHSNLNSIYAVE